MNILKKAKLNFWQIINMNFGFFGLQYSFGLQQANMSPIYSYLGAEGKELPILMMAGPMTGLIIQPIVGSLSDRTLSKWGRRTPYFLIGAIFCSLCLFIMPFSSTIWMAAGVLWILDAANNITQEPYRAFVSDKLDEKQHSIGFLSQSAFTGLGQTLSYLTPTLLIFIFPYLLSDKSSNGIPTTTFIAFFIGSVVSIGSILWSLYTTKENPLSQQEIDHIKRQPKGFGHVFTEIFEAFKTMPTIMKQMIPMMFFSWYAMFIFWQFMVKCVSITGFNTNDTGSEAFRSADLLWGQMGAFYNVITFISAFLLAYIARKKGPKLVHFVSLALAGICLFFFPLIKDTSLMFLPMIGVGISWASMMGTPYIMLAGGIPPEKTGIYMGIFNMFIVIPMLIQTVTFSYIYSNFLGEDPRNAIRMVGIMLILAALSLLFIKNKKTHLT